MRQIEEINKNVYLINSSIHQIGYTARSLTPGKEMDMVEDFIFRYVDHYKISDGEKLAIFLEPMVDTGYPDIVMVFYKSNIETVWDETRKRLTSQHYKVLYEIDRRKKVAIDALSFSLGYDIKSLTRIINDLEKARLVCVRKNSVIRIAYRNYYCIKKVVAIEAKLSRWTDAMEQALQNTRFSNESFILMNRCNCNDFYRKRCEALGIGVLLLNGKLVQSVKPPKRHMPGSYISFLYNHWISQINTLLEVKNDRKRILE